MRLVKIICAVYLSASALSAQVAVTAASGPASSGTPAYILYRLFFRDIAALEAAAAKSDAAGLSGRDLAPRGYQRALSLSDAEKVALNKTAAECNLTLDQHQQKAQPIILAMQKANAALSAAGSLPDQLAALENERTAISNACIQSFQSAIGARKFADIDVFVRTKFAQKVSAILPANAPFGDTPVKRTGGGK